MQRNVRTFCEQRERHTEVHIKWGLVTFSRNFDDIRYVTARTRYGDHDSTGGRWCYFHTDKLSTEVIHSQVMTCG